MKNSTFLALLPLILILSFCSENKIPERPNILFIAVDDLRPELNCFGASHIQSPNIDELAAGGIIFEKAYCQVPVCGASRASLLTGIRPTASRFLTYDTWAEKDAPESISLPRYLKDNGYYTISNGKVFHHRKDMENSWSEEPWHPSMDQTGPVNWRDYQKPENVNIAFSNVGRGPAFEKLAGPDTMYFDGKIAEKSLRDLERLEKMGKPFFLAVGFLKPHLPFNAPEKYWDLYPDEVIETADNPFPPENAPEASLHNWGELRAYDGIPSEGALPDSIARTLIHGYYACVSFTDTQVGKLLRQLDYLDLTDNTIIILWGDHGWNLGEHGLWCKHCNYETSLRAPIILKVPWKAGNQKTEALVEFIDIYPTLCELTNLPDPGHLQGQSLVPYIDNPSLPGKEYVYSRFHRGESVKNTSYRYTEWLDENRQRYAMMLYDHQQDYAENHNIVMDSILQDEVNEFQKLASELREKL